MRPRESAPSRHPAFLIGMQRRTLDQRQKRMAWPLQPESTARDEIQDVGRLKLRVAAIVEVEPDLLAAVTITDREPPVVAGYPPALSR